MAVRRFAGNCAASSDLLLDARRPSAQQLFFGHEVMMLNF
jgi:hypothetical protein